MREAFPFTIQQVAELVGLIPAPQAKEGTASYNVRCPFCDDTKYHMNIDRIKNTYRCARCEAGGGALDLYGRIVHNEPCVAGPNGNSRKLYTMLCNDLHLDTSVNVEIKKKSEIKVIERASDNQVHKAYARLLAHPALALTQKHKQSLLDRGLSESAVVRYHYRSFNPDTFKMSDEAREIYQRVANIVVKTSALKKFPPLNIIAGIQLALWVQEAGIDLQGVPGFFHLADIWCLKLPCSGIIIPTRNMSGKIVALQIRNDTGKGSKYLTVSAKGLPSAVNTNICRVHFPLGNAPLTYGAPVVLTEGPLKADIAQERMPNTFFMAIAGVNNTTDLSNVAGLLPAFGVSTIYNALDMDKLTNINVMKGSKDIRKLLTEKSLCVHTLFWDEKYAEARYAKLLKLCKENNICVDFLDTSNTYTAIARMTERLVGADVKVRKDWRSKTKGIDDFLVGSKNFSAKNSA